VVAIAVGWGCMVVEGAKRVRVPGGIRRGLRSSAREELLHQSNGPWHERGAGSRQVAAHPAYRLRRHHLL
jgi:hypothetical protein